MATCPMTLPKYPEDRKLHTVGSGVPCLWPAVVRGSDCQGRANTFSYWPKLNKDCLDD